MSDHAASPASDDSNLPQSDVSRLIGNLRQTLCEVEANEVDGPHLMICQDEAIGLKVFVGPFTSGIAALRAAEIETRTEIRTGGSARYSVAPLLPPPESTN